MKWIAMLLLVAGTAGAADLTGDWYLENLSGGVVAIKITEEHIIYPDRGEREPLEMTNSTIRIGGATFEYSQIEDTDGFTLSFALTERDEPDSDVRAMVNARGVAGYLLPREE